MFGECSTQDLWQGGSQVHSPTGPEIHQQSYQGECRHNLTFNTEILICSSLIADLLRRLYAASGEVSKWQRGRLLAAQKLGNSSGNVVVVSAAAAGQIVGQDQSADVVF